MPSKKCRLPTEFGQFSKLSSQRINEIKETAVATARAYKGGNKATYDLLIKAANKQLSKHETGVFSAFMMAEVSK